MLCHLGTHLHPTERSYKTRPGNPVVPDVDFGSSGEMEWRSQPTERPRAYGPSEPAQGPRTGLKAELQPSQASGARQRRLAAACSILCPTNFFYSHLGLCTSPCPATGPQTRRQHPPLLTACPWPAFIPPMKVKWGGELMPFETKARLHCKKWP